MKRKNAVNRIVRGRCMSRVYDPPSPRATRCRVLPQICHPAHPGLNLFLRSPGKSRSGPPAFWTHRSNTNLPGATRHGAEEVTPEAVPAASIGPTVPDQSVRTGCERTVMHGDPASSNIEDHRVHHARPFHLQAELDSGFARGVAAVAGPRHARPARRAASRRDHRAARVILEVVDPGFHDRAGQSILGRELDAHEPAPRRSRSRESRPGPTLPAPAGAGWPRSTTTSLRRSRSR